MFISCCCPRGKTEDRSPLLPNESLEGRSKADAVGRQIILSTSATSGDPVSLSSSVKKVGQLEEDALALQGHARAEQGDHEEALKLLQRSLKLRIEKFGEFNKNNLQSLHCEMNCYLWMMESLDALKRIEEAVSYGKKAIKAQDIYYGTRNHEAVARTIHSLGMIYLSGEDNKNALLFFLQEAEICSKIHVEEHSSIANSFMFIGITLTRLKRFAEAWDYLQKSLSMYKKIHGEKDKATQETKEAIVNLYHELLKMPDYEEGCNQILQLHISKYGEKHVETARFCWTIGTELKTQGKKDQALIYLEKASTIRKSLQTGV